jgi:prophage maintenance system killer protein
MDSGLANELQRWLDVVGTTNLFKGDCRLGIHDVLRAHFLIADHFARRGEPVGLPGPRYIGLLESAVSRQSTGFGSVDKWTARTELVATLFFGLVMDHPFHDGNKRTAALCALYHLLECGLTPTVDRRELERVTVKLADGTLGADVHYKRRLQDFGYPSNADAIVLFLAWWFKRNSRHVDKRTYEITYRDLETILHKFGLRMGDARGNQISVFRDKQERRLLGGTRTVTETVCRIGFPRWTAQVGPGVIAAVRRSTGLTAEQGCDSQSFFNEAIVLRRLIDDYEGLLRRLRDR